MEQKKQLILSDIVNEIRDIVEKLLTLDIRSEEYKSLSIKKEELEKEYDILNDLNSKNSINYLSDFSNRKYSIINDLINDENCSIALLKIYKNFYDGLAKNKSFIDAKDFISDEVSLNDEFYSKMSNAKNSNQFNIILVDEARKESSFIDAKKRFLNLTRCFSKEKYYNLNNIINNKMPLTKEILKDYKGMVSDGLIRTIEEELDNMNKKIFIKEENKEKLKENIIYRYVLLLKKQVEDYIRKSFIQIEYIVKIPVKQNGDFLEFFDSIISGLNNKQKHFKELEKETLIFKHLTELNEYNFINSLKSLNIDFSNLSDYERNSFYNITYNDLLNYVAKVNINNKLLNKQKHI